MMPPPSTTSRRGTSVCASRPVESTQRGESIPSIGGRSGNEPVATIALLNWIVLAALDRERVRAAEAAAALHPLDAVRLEEAGDAARHLLDDAVLPLDGLAEVELWLAARRRRTWRRPRPPGGSRARSAPRPSSGCSPPAGRCRRARAPARRRRPSRPAGLRGSLPCTRRGLRPGRRRHIPSLNLSVGSLLSMLTMSSATTAPSYGQHPDEGANHEEAGRIDVHVPRRRDRQPAELEPALLGRGARRLRAEADGRARTSCCSAGRPTRGSPRRGRSGRATRSRTRSTRCRSTSPRGR